MAEIIDRLESNVRFFSRQYPAVFKSALGSSLYDEDGREFIDFFSAAGSINLGHNCPRINQALVQYIQAGGIQSSLDLATGAKIDFLDQFERVILNPRDLDFRAQFTGPSGSDAVEAAVKLARKQTGRSTVVAFTGASHGHTLGALTVSSQSNLHSEFYGSHNNIQRLPFDGFGGLESCGELLECVLEESGSGITKPAAVILETVQIAGGVNVASTKWLRRVAKVCQQRDIRLIVDDCSAGCGRTGQFFSFEQSGIKPDMVCLAKSIGGGQPMSLLLIRRDLDTGRPGEHPSTFRGNNLAFVAGRAALDYWQQPNFELEILQRGTRIKAALDEIANQADHASLAVRGRGMVWGLDLGSSLIANEVIELAFRRGLLVSSAGSKGQVLRLLPALNIPLPQLDRGLEILKHCVSDVLKFRKQTSGNHSLLDCLISESATTNQGNGFDCVASANYV